MTFTARALASAFDGSLEARFPALLTFYSFFANMQQGFNGTLGQLEKYLEQQLA